MNVNQIKTICCQALVTLSSILVFPSTSISQTEVTAIISELAKAGNSTKASLEHKTLSWTTVFETPNPDILYLVEVVKSPRMRRFVLSYQSRDVKAEIVDICERDGFWYVQEPGKAPIKTRPYEVILSSATHFHYLAISDIAYISNTDSLKFESQSDEEVHLRRQLTVPHRQRIQFTLKKFREMLGTIAQMSPEREEALEKSIQGLEMLLEEGIPITVNRKYGIVTADTYQSRKVWVKDLKWVKGKELPLFQIDSLEFLDHTESLVANESDRNDLIIINHALTWNPEMSAANTDAVLLNIKTGQNSRIPYRFGNVVPGTACFSKDRERVYLSGGVLQGESAAIFEVNLISGEHRRLTSPKKHGFMMTPSLSPDGKSLAVPYLEHDVDSNMPQTQMLTIDIASGSTTNVGLPLDVAYHSWTSNGDGLIMSKRENRTRNDNGKSTIVRMDLAGGVTSIIPGRFPYMLARGNRILFHDEVLDQWKTCDLSGDNVRLVGDGLSDFGSPGVSPSDARAVMMKFGGPKGPRPFIVDLVTGEVDPLPVSEGYWGAPVWR